MNCQACRDQLHGMLDEELGQAEAIAVETHLRLCADCLTAYQELLALRQLLSAPSHLPAPLERQLWRSLERERTRHWPDRARHFWGNLRSWVRDLDQTLVWARLSAIPATLFALMVLQSMFPQGRIEQWDYTVLAAGSTALQGQHSTYVVQVVQPTTQFNGLMDTAWKIPYEDSLWLVADIQPDGNAEIGDVIEYPKNTDLLAAVDQTLRHSKFDVAKQLSDPIVIFGFQKVDVYEAATMF